MKPRELKYKTGTVYLSGYTKDEANAIESMLLNTEKDTKVILKEKELEVPVEPTEMNDIAVGLHFNKAKKEYQLVSIKYNADSRMSQVVAVDKAGDFKQLAVNNLKIRIQELFI